MSMVELQRVDPAQNMSRFYSLNIEPDLFGGARLVRQWGRIGAHGCVKVEHYDDEAQAVEALNKHAARKLRRGYQNASRT